MQLAQLQYICADSKIRSTLIIQSFKNIVKYNHIVKTSHYV